MKTKRGRVSMTQEYIELLATDISARVKCGVYIRHGINRKSILTGIEHKKHPKRWIIIAEGSCFYLDDIKPYLRPMSSMTEEEKNIYEYNRNSNVEVVKTALFDWLNKNHFDYRGLIPIGLALEAPEGMYK